MEAVAAVVLEAIGMPRSSRNMDVARRAARAVLAMDLEVANAWDDPGVKHRSDILRECGLPRDGYTPEQEILAQHEELRAEVEELKGQLATELARGAEVMREAIVSRLRHEELRTSATLASSIALPTPDGTVTA
jgi:hypothetical protein